jgi:hypothetical protein
LKSVRDKSQFLAPVIENQLPVFYAPESQVDVRLRDVRLLRNFMLDL